MTRLNFSRHANKNRCRGFTLLEMMVVVMIIGLLASVVVPNILANKNRANQKKAVTDIVALESALDMYYMDYNHYPTQSDGLQSLVQPSTGSNMGGYIRRVPKDPWGREYHYQVPGTHSQVDIFSYGEDGLPGGEGSASDIGNWNVDDF